MLTTLNVPPAELVSNPWNSNVVSKDHEAKLDEAVKRLGLFKPIVCRELLHKKKGGPWLEILGGQHRWEAAKRLGLAEVPVVNLGVIPDSRAKEISLADNSRYGVDDSLALAEMIKSLDDPESLQVFLPYNEIDLKSIFSSSDIDLDNLGIDENFETSADEAPEKVAKAPKTHTVMRFKVSIGDAERISGLIAKINKTHGYTTADDLTNAGDGLVHLLFALNEDLG